MDIFTWVLTGAGGKGRRNWNNKSLETWGIGKEIVDVSDSLVYLFPSLLAI